ncbi:MAG: hypothetical protein NC394_02830 [Bacteroides sp.]|nr:hypothetical protein [Bacteroides sp.]
MNLNGITTVNTVPIAYTKRNAAEQKEKNGGPKTDTLTLTEEARKFLDAQKALENPSKNKREEYKDDLQLFLEHLNSDVDEDKSSRFMDLAKCMKIARRILNGDKVPMKDRKFLAEKDRKLYEMALTFQRHNPKPKKYKTVLDENDEESAENQGECSQVSGAGSGLSAAALAEGLGE